MRWAQYIEQFNQHIKVQLKQFNDGSFCFMSSLDTWIYGQVFEPIHKPSFPEVIVLYHGLGAHLNTQGYIDIAQSWTKKGFYVIGMDVRNQGGKTQGFPIRHPNGLYMSGYESSKTYYYHQVYLDAYRLIDVASMLLPDAKIYVTGGSQGGALAIFAGTYHPNVALVMADMPSCIDIPYLIHQTESGFKVFKTDGSSHDSISNEVMQTLLEIDLLIICKDLSKPILLASGDKDRICPLETTQSFYHQLTCEKELIVYKGYGHGGFDDLHWHEKHRFIMMHRKNR